MQQPEHTRARLRDTEDAVLFDRDGGITDRPSRHATCWTQRCEVSLQPSWSTLLIRRPWPRGASGWRA